MVSGLLVPRSVKLLVDDTVQIFFSISISGGTKLRRSKFCFITFNLCSIKPIKPEKQTSLNLKGQFGVAQDPDSKII